MSQLSELVEFDRYRFARDDSGGLAEFRSNLTGERIFLVVDCERYQLARLHVLEGARAGKGEKSVQWFRREMEAVRRLRHPQLNPVLSYGEDDTELFYSEAVVDGEPLGEYLRRNGPVPSAHAIRLTLELIAILNSNRARPRTLENFSLNGLFLKPDPAGNAKLIFSDYSGWNQDCLLSESRLVERVTRLLVSLLAGEFVEASAPDLQFPDAPESLRDLIETSACGDYDPRLERLNSFREALKKIREESSGYVSKMAPPRRQLRDWFENEEIPLKIGPDFSRLSQAGLNGSASSPEDSFSIDARPERAIGPRKVRFQLFPGETTIPTLAWLEQHRTALRRSGRGFPNQLRVTTTLIRGKCLLIGEEQVEGLSLRSIVDKAGPLDLPHLLSLARKLNAALDSIEKSAGACPVWWLPPENLFIVTGKPDIASLHDALDRFGTETWQRLPVRLRLHQTAESLLTGVELPGALLGRMRFGARNGDAARRLAVMLPFFWYGLTGQRLRWNEPLVRPDDRESVSSEIVATLDRLRRQLLADPSGIPTSVIDLLAGDENPTDAEVTSSKPHFQPISIQNLAPVSKASEPKPEPSFTADRINTEVTVPSPGDDLAGKSEDKSAGVPKLPQPAPTDVRVLESSDSLPMLEDLPPALVPPFPKDGSPTLALSDEPESAAIESLGVIDDDSFSVVREDQEPSEAETPVSESAEDSGNDELPEEVETVVDSPPPGFLGPEPEVEDGDQRSFKSPTQPAFFPASGSGRSGFGERLLDITSPAITKTSAEPSSGGKSFAHVWIRLTCFSLLAIGLFWGVARAIGEVSSWASRQALAEETFLLTHYPDMKTTRPAVSISETGAPAFGGTNGPGIPAIDSLPETVTVESVGEAIRFGDNNREIGQFSAAISYYLRALELESSSSEARTQLQDCLQAWSETDQLPALGSEQISLLGKAADFAPLAASARLAEHFRNRDSQLYRQWLTRSAEAGNVAHQRDLGLLLARIPGEMIPAAEWFRKAADRGDAAARFHFGECLVFGRGVARNVRLAVDDYLPKAAHAGDGRAMELLGVCFAEGRNVTADPVRARVLFEKAIAAGNFDAYYDLAVRYAKGHGAGRNEDEAARLFREGAEKGDAACMYAYGRCLETGFGVSRDFDGARSWLRKAAGLGFDDARAWCGLNGVVLADSASN